ncbi:loricrin-like [Hypanus sabinus]|uniref:loricrin-like n=1 Tax=Hypanus sabinus TaxID=79690 RepID=UPI0028C4A1B3|nr:loricrin-like [Hypanus sabinus]XP_059841133.1 loricrin-like [Hypanus sabinus]XP_059841134.1 loricrin-like [Hypanus sabinus]
MGGVGVGEGCVGNRGWDRQLWVCGERWGVWVWERGVWGTGAGTDSCGCVERDGGYGCARRGVCGEQGLGQTVVGVWREMGGVGVHGEGCVGNRGWDRQLWVCGERWGVWVCTERGVWGTGAGTDSCGCVERDGGCGCARRGVCGEQGLGQTVVGVWREMGGVGVHGGGVWGTGAGTDSCGCVERDGGCGCGRGMCGEQGLGQTVVGVWREMGGVGVGEGCAGNRGWDRQLWVCGERWGVWVCTERGVWGTGAGTDSCGCVERDGGCGCARRGVCGEQGLGQTVVGVWREMGGVGVHGGGVWGTGAGTDSCGCAERDGGCGCARRGVCVEQGLGQTVVGVWREMGGVGVGEGCVERDGWCGCVERDGGYGCARRGVCGEQGLGQTVVGVWREMGGVGVHGEGCVWNKGLGVKSKGQGVR